MSSEFLGCQSLTSQKFTWHLVFGVDGWNEQMKDRFQESGPLGQRIAPLDLLAWLRKGKLLQCFLSVGPKEWSSGPQLFEVFFSLPCMSQKCHGLNRNLFFCRLSFSGVQSVEHMMWHGNFQNMCQQKNWMPTSLGAVKSVGISAN